MKYNETNIAYLINKLKRLSRERGISANSIYVYLDKKVHILNEERKNAARIEGNSPGAIRLLGRSTFYDRLSNPQRLMSAICEDVFQIMIEYLEDFGEITSQSPAEKIVSIHPYISTFIDISSHDDQYGRQMLPGYYRTYRPAIGRPGYAVTGLLHIFEDPESGALETYEIMAYQPKKAPKKRPRHTFRGMAWYSKGHYLILSTDSNTKFMQTVILRSMNVDEHEEQLEGSYLTITNKGGRHIVCSKIILDRLHCHPGSGKAWIEALKGTIGYKHPDHSNPKRRIKRSIWERIDPDRQENMTRM